ncbi:MAG TPA: ABC transporter substrate-binding protein [Stellaceae bacterium]|nr:ABC transporter substrate-binding protein [Stellaceae bacterium]
MPKRLLVAVLLLVPALALSPAWASERPVVRVGVLKFGTVSWELDVMRRHGFDRAHGIDVEPLELAGKDSAAVALQGGAVDVILTDWLWVARRRGLGGDFTFAPHSHAAGSLIVRADSGIKQIADLKGRKIGIAGGPIDKSWLILRAYAKKAAGLDLVRDADPVFAAPPLLTETLRKGNLAAVLNFWQYNARLPAADYVELIRIEDMLAALNLAPETPLLGWVFSERWAKSHAAALRGFLDAAAAARAELARSPEEWRAIAPLTQVADAEVLDRLRLAYARGISDETPSDLGGAAQRLLDLLMSFGGIDEAPADGRVPPGTFFAGAP